MRSSFTTPQSQDPPGSSSIPSPAVGKGTGILEMKGVSTMDIMMGRYKIVQPSASSSTDGRKNPKNSDPASLKKSLSIQNKPSSNSVLEESPDKDEHANHPAPVETERTEGQQVVTERQMVASDGTPSSAVSSELKEKSKKRRKVKAAGCEQTPGGEM